MSRKCHIKGKWCSDSADWLMASHSLPWMSLLWRRPAEAQWIAPTIQTAPPHSQGSLFSSHRSCLIFCMCVLKRSWEKWIWNSTHSTLDWRVATVSLPFQSHAKNWDLIYCICWEYFHIWLFNTLGLKEWFRVRERWSCVVLFQCLFSLII